MNIRALVIAGALMVGGSLAADAQTVLVKSVFGSGGGPMSGGGYSVNGTIGQAVIGPTSGGGYTALQGFWYGNLKEASVETHNDGAVAGFALDQNYPNPFNPSTTIRYTLPERTKVTIRVMNLLGEEVKKVVDQEMRDAGINSVEFNADDLPSGTYVYRLEAGSFVASKKMVLLK